ncbi:MAG: hypothetical protein KC503_25425 [Myxococcales bacterium]|nr:hypothetical protein [Myxococcales bacterium]
MASKKNRSENDGAREALADRQAELARYLARDGDVPGGFDEQRLEAAKGALDYKKALEREREKALGATRPGFFTRLWRYLRGR